MFYHQVNDISPKDRYRFVYAEYLMELLLREDYFGEPRTCHIIARAVAPLIQARVVSGSFITLFEDGKVCDNEHSWIALKSGWILDLKPIGIVSRGPVLIQAKPFGPGYFWYHRLSRNEWPKDIGKTRNQKSVTNMRTALANVLMKEPPLESDMTSRFSSLL